MYIVEHSNSRRERGADLAVNWLKEARSNQSNQVVALASFFFCRSLMAALMASSASTEQYFQITNFEKKTGKYCFDNSAYFVFEKAHFRTKVGFDNDAGFWFHIESNSITINKCGFCGQNISLTKLWLGKKFTNLNNAILREASAVPWQFPGWWCWRRCQPVNYL